MAKQESEEKFTAAVERLAQSIESLTAAVAGRATAAAVAAPTEVAPPKPPPKPKKAFCPACGVDTAAPGAEHEVGCEEAAKAATTKPNGKKADVEEMSEEMKKLILELAQKTNRATVVALLEKFGAQRASDVPVVKLPEFVAALRAAVARAS